MSEYIKRIRTTDGDKQIDYESLANLPTLVEVDDTLTQSGKAADAKVVGDKLNELEKTTVKSIVRTKRGVTISISDSEELPLHNIKAFGKSTQDGTPTTETPVEIVSVENPVITVAKRNLLPITDVAQKKDRGLTQVISGGVCTVSGTASSTSAFNLTLGGSYYATDPILVLAPGVYTLKDCMITNAGSKKKYQNETFTLTEPFGVTWIATRSYGATEVINETTYPRLYSGNESDPWEQHDGQTISVNRTLRGIPVPSGGNYTDSNGQQWICDEIDFERGVYIQRIKEDKVEDWGIASYNITESPNGLKWQVSKQFMDSSLNGTLGDAILSMMVNKFPLVNYTVENDEDTGDCMSAYGHATHIEYRFRLLKSKYETKDDVINMMANTKVYYPFATPIETPLTEDELALYATLHTNYPFTTLVNNEGSPMEISYTANANLVIKNVTDAIEALGGTV